jgi:hypothetical protein
MGRPRKVDWTNSTHQVPTLDRKKGAKIPRACRDYLANGEDYKCEYCGEILPIHIWRYRTNLVCNNDCRKRLTLVKEAEAKDFMLETKAKKDTGRRCIVCGENCWPNYFYCSKHTREDGSGYGI